MWFVILSRVHLRLFRKFQKHDIFMIAWKKRAIHREKLHTIWKKEHREWDLRWRSLVCYSPPCKMHGCLAPFPQSQAETRKRRCAKKTWANIAPMMKGTGGASISWWMNGTISLLWLYIYIQDLDIINPWKFKTYEWMSFGMKSIMKDDPL